MSIFVAPFRSHSVSIPVPTGITGTSWAYVVSSTSQAELEALCTAIGVSTANIRTPALGSLVTYVGLTETGRADALAAASEELPVFPAPTEGLARGQAFDGPASSFEPVA